MRVSRRRWIRPERARRREAGAVCRVPFGAPRRAPGHVIAKGSWLRHIRSAGWLEMRQTVASGSATPYRDCRPLQRREQFPGGDREGRRMSDSEVARSEGRHRLSREPALAVTPLPDGSPMSAPPTHAPSPTDLSGVPFRFDGRRAAWCPPGARMSDGRGAARGPHNPRMLGPSCGPRCEVTFTRSLLLPRRGLPGDTAPAAGAQAPAAELRRTVYWGSSPDALRGPPR